MVVPHAADVGVLPQGEDLPDHCHPAQSTVDKLHDLRVTNLLHTQTCNILKPTVTKKPLNKYIKPLAALRTVPANKEHCIGSKPIGITAEADIQVLITFTKPTN